MQSTSSVKSSLSVLIKNFFIAGLSQETIRTRVDMKFQDQINIEPEILFSMYQSNSEMQSYLKFIFPSKIAIERTENSDAVVPKFFTFMSTDSDGHNAYFHCLFFFEQFTNDDIKADFDNVVLESHRRSSHRRHDE